MNYPVIKCIKAFDLNLPVRAGCCLNVYQVIIGIAIVKISQESVSGTAVNNIGFWRFLINKINGSSIGNAVFHGSDEEGKRVVFVRKIEVGNSSFNGRGFRHFYLE